jgi:dCTP deaminase
MILSDQDIRARVVGDIPYKRHSQYRLGIEPFCERTQACGMSYGISAAGYDIRIGAIDKSTCGKGSRPTQSWWVAPGEFVLLASLERIKMPVDLIAVVHDKSTLARKGLALQNTVLEPGWEGYITLELSNHSEESVQIQVGQPIAQLLFHQLRSDSTSPYKGKYQNQPAEPVHAKFVTGDDPDGH